MKSETKGILMTLAGASCWGLSGSVGQYLFTAEHMDSRWLVPVRLGAAGILVLVYCFTHYGAAATVSPFRGWQKTRAMLIYGLAGVAACQFLYFLTIQLSNAAIGTILQETSPIFVLLYVCFTSKRLPRRSEIISILLALLGVFLLTTHGDIRTLTVPAAAIVTGILSAVCVMIYNVTAPGLTKTIPVLIIQGWAFFMGGAVFAMIFRIWDSGYELTFRGMLGVLFVIVVGNILAFWLYITGVGIIGPQRGILYSFAEPVTAALISAAVLKTRYTIYDLAGFVCIFAMLWMITFRRNEE